MKTVIFHDADGQIIRWAHLRRSGDIRTPRGLRRLVLDHAVDDPMAFRVEGGALVPREACADEAMARLRRVRDALLAASDWTQLPDAACDRAAWARYRRALRDMTETADPFNPEFPAEPRRGKK